MVSTAARTCSSVALPALIAVEMSPRPSGFVRYSRSPGRISELRTSRSGATSPVTAMPYFGSASRIEWPPTTATPASAATAAPPSRTRASRSSGRSSTGHATRFSAVSGRPPIAYTSLSAFVAAIRPQSYGSSTIGVKKSTVWTSSSPDGSR